MQVPGPKCVIDPAVAVMLDDGPTQFFTHPVTNHTPPSSESRLRLPLAAAAGRGALHKSSHVSGERDLLDVALAGFLMEPDVLLWHYLAAAWVLASHEQARTLRASHASEACEGPSQACGQVCTSKNVRACCGKPRTVR